MGDLKRIKAAMVAIGDELLSGRTRDINIHKLAGWLTTRGVDLTEVRIVSDDEAAIVEAVNDLRARNKYVFTSGGIGPTHDDITANSIAAAFGLQITEREDAVAILQGWYDKAGEELTASRRRMARIPDGADLINNMVSGAPGFVLENVFVMAGVPGIFANMLSDIDPLIERGVKLNSVTISGAIKESEIAEGLEALQADHPELAIGSYPGNMEQAKKKIRGVSVVIRGPEQAVLETLAKKVADLMRAVGADPETS